MAATELCVLIDGVIAGTLSQDGSGLASFRYLPRYDGPPLSVSMPRSNRTYPQRAIRPYLLGLLPDSEEQRRAIAGEHGVRPNNPVALLGHIGLDCPGSVQFCPNDGESIRAALGREAHYVPLSDHEVASRLRAIRTDADESWLGKDEHWSLGGNQGKFALALHGGRWCACQGSAATTHIFKNGVVGYRLQALNEFVCMKTARACGLDAADVSYRYFDDEPALIVERYDRAVSDGRVRRLHQEDLCQALGVYPSQKYTADGGPSAYDVLALLATTSEAARANLRSFSRALFYNYLVGAPDAHAKNYSLLLPRDAPARLAHLYGVASGLAYGMGRQGRLAMAIGGENRYGRVGRGALARHASGNDGKVRDAMEGAGLDTYGCVDLMRSLAREVPAAMEAVFDDNRGLAGIDELRDHLLAPVRRNCETTLALLAGTPD